MSQSQTITRPTEETSTQTQDEKKNAPMYRVILWNDDHHTFKYVIHMMQKIFSYSKIKGEAIAHQVHNHGKVTVAVLPLEIAEFKRNQIRNFGPDILVDDCISSMFATIEKVEE
ncbi:MAG: ATP-dependent Clp protease adaptor ClpS [Planctomycetia bacterium]|nr:ATP-dependent Clp protease adaptor ClpS [Planctomycetia bacterium]